jgi:hypothetical protein
MGQEKRSRTASFLLGAQLRSGDKAAIKRVVDAYRKTEGVELKAAELLGVPRRTLINWRNVVPELDKALREAREAREDAAEG